MRNVIVAMLCAGFAFGSVARADLAKGSWAPDIEAKVWHNTDEPVTLYECRGMVVVLFFWVSWHQGGEYVIQLMNAVNSEFGRRQGVFVIGLTDAELSRVKDMLDNERVLFPVGTESKSFEEYGIDSFPRVVVIDPEGKVAWTGWPGQGGGGALIREIRDVVSETPPNRTHPEEAKKANTYLKQARDALRDDDYRKAYRSAESAYECALTGDPLKTRCQDMVDLVESLGRDKYARAEVAIEERQFDKSVTLLREITREFKGAEVAISASQRLKAIKKKYKEVADIIAKRRDETIAENILYDATQLIRGREFGEGYDKLDQIVSEYGDTDAATKAQTIIDRIKQNADVMAYVKDHQAEPECKTWLSQARAFVRMGQPVRARELYQHVVETYPDTVWADDARRRLAQLR